MKFGIDSIPPIGINTNNNSPVDNTPQVINPFYNPNNNVVGFKNPFYGNDINNNSYIENIINQYGGETVEGQDVFGNIPDKYQMGIPRGILQDTNAWNQTWGTMALKSLGQIAVTLVGETVGSIGSLAFWQNENALTEAGSAITNWGKEVMPIYLSQKDEKGGLVGSPTWRNIFSGLPTVASAAASMIPTLYGVRIVNWIGKALKRIKSFGTIKQSAELINNINRINTMVKAGGLTKGSSVLSKIAAGVKSKQMYQNAAYGIGKALTSKTGNIVTGGIIGAHLDTAIEVAYQMPEWKRYAKEELGMNDIEAQEYADDVASSAYWNGIQYGFIFNAISTASILRSSFKVNMFGFEGSFKKAITQSIKSGKPVSEFLKDGFNASFKRELGRKALDITSTFFSEGAEEMRVDIALNEGKYKVDKERGYSTGDAADTWFGRFVQHLSDTRNWDSFIWGGIGGGAMVIGRSNLAVIAHPKKYTETRNKEIQNIISGIDEISEIINGYKGSLELKFNEVVDEKTGETKYVGYESPVDDLLIPVFSQIITTKSAWQGKILIDGLSKLTDAELTASGWSTNARENAKVLSREFDRANNAIEIASNKSFKGKYKNVHETMYSIALYRFGLYQEQLEKGKNKLAQKQIELEQNTASFEAQISDKVKQENKNLQDEIDTFDKRVKTYDELIKHYDYQIRRTKQIDTTLNKQFRHAETVNVETEDKLNKLRHGHESYTKYYKSQLEILRNRELTDNITKEEREIIREKRKQLKSEYIANTKLEEQLENERNVDLDEIDRINTLFKINEADADIKKSQLRGAERFKGLNESKINSLNEKKGQLSDEAKKEIDFYEKEKKLKHDKFLLDKEYGYYQQAVDEIEVLMQQSKVDVYIHETPEEIEETGKAYDKPVKESRKERKRKEKERKEIEKRKQEDKIDETSPAVVTGNVEDENIKEEKQEKEQTEDEDKLEPNKIYRYKDDEKIQFVTDANGNIQYVQINHRILEKFARGSIIRFTNGKVMVIKSIRFIDNDVYVNEMSLSEFTKEFDKTVINYHLDLELVNSLDDTEAQEKLIKYLNNTIINILNDNYVSNLIKFLNDLLPIKHTKNEKLKKAYDTVIKVINTKSNEIKIFNKLVFDINKLNVIKNIDTIIYHLDKIATLLSQASLHVYNGVFEIKSFQYFNDKLDDINAVIKNISQIVNNPLFNNSEYAMNYIFRLFRTSIDDAFKNSQRIYNTKIAIMLDNYGTLLIEDDESVQKLKSFIEILNLAYKQLNENEKVDNEIIDKLKKANVENLQAEGVDVVNSGFDLIKKSILPVYRNIIRINENQESRENQQDNEEITDLVFSLVQFSDNKEVILNSNDFIPNNENTENKTTDKTSNIIGSNDIDEHDYRYYFISPSEAKVFEKVSKFITKIAEKHRDESFKLSFEDILSALSNDTITSTDEGKTNVSRMAFPLFNILNKFTSNKFIENITNELNNQIAKGIDIKNIGDFNKIKNGIIDKIEDLNKDLKKYIRDGVVNMDEYLAYFFKENIKEQPRTTTNGTIIENNIFKKLSEAINEQTQELADKITIDGVEYNTIDLLNTYNEIRQGTPIEYSINENEIITLQVKSSITGTLIKVGELIIQTHIHTMPIEYIDKNGKKTYKSFLGNSQGLNEDLKSFVNLIEQNDELFEILREIYLQHDKTETKTALSTKFREFIDKEDNKPIKNLIAHLIYVNENKETEFTDEEILDKIYTIIQSMFRTYSKSSIDKILNINSQKVINTYEKYNKAVYENYKSSRKIYNAIQKGKQIKLNVSHVNIGSIQYNEDSRVLNNLYSVIPETNKNDNGEIEIYGVLRTRNMTKTFNITNNSQKQIPELLNKKDGAVFYAHLNVNGRDSYIPLRNGKISRKTQYTEALTWYVKERIIKIIEDLSITNSEEKPKPNEDDKNKEKSKENKDIKNTKEEDNKEEPKRINKKVYDDIIKELNQVVVTQHEDITSKSFFNVGMLFKNNHKSIDIHSLDNNGKATYYRITMQYDETNKLEKITVKARKIEGNFNYVFENPFTELTGKNGYQQIKNRKTGETLLLKNIKNKTDLEDFTKDILEPIIAGMTRNVPIKRTVPTDDNKSKTIHTLNNENEQYDKEYDKFKDEIKDENEKQLIKKPLNEIVNEIKKYNEKYTKNVPTEFENEQDFYIKTEALVSGINPITNKEGKPILINDPSTFNIFFDTTELIFEDETNEEINEETINNEIIREDITNPQTERFEKAQQTLEKIIKQTDNEEGDWITVLDRKGLFTEELLYNLGIIDETISAKQLIEIKKLFKEAFKGEDIKLFFKNFNDYKLSELQELYKKRVEGKNKEDFRNIFENTNGYYSETNNELVIHDTEFSRTKQTVGRTLLHETVHAVFKKRLINGRVSNYYVSRLKENIDILSGVLKSKNGKLYFGGKNETFGMVSIQQLNEVERKTLENYLAFISNSKNSHEELVAYTLENSEFANILNKITFYDIRNKTKQTWWNRIITAILGAIGIKINKDSALRAIVNVMVSPHLSLLMGVTNIENIILSEQLLQEEFKDNPKEQVTITDGVVNDKTINENENIKNKITNENIDEVIKKIDEKVDTGKDFKSDKNRSKGNKGVKFSYNSDNNTNFVTYIRSKADVQKVIKQKRQLINYDTFRKSITNLINISKEDYNNEDLLYDRIMNTIKILYGDIFYKINAYLNNTNKEYYMIPKGEKPIYIIENYKISFNKQLYKDIAEYFTFKFNAVNDNREKRIKKIFDYHFVNNTNTKYNGQNENDKNYSFNLENSDMKNYKLITDNFAEETVQDIINGQQIQSNNEVSENNNIVSIKEELKAFKENFRDDNNDEIC